MFKYLLFCVLVMRNSKTDHICNIHKVLIRSKKEFHSRQWYYFLRGVFFRPLALEDDVTAQSRNATQQTRCKGVQRLGKRKGCRDMLSSSSPRLSWP